MSSDTDSLRSFLTETEIEAGITSLDQFDDDAESGDEDDGGSFTNPPREKSEKRAGCISAERVKIGAKLIGGLDCVKKIKRRLTNKLLQENTDYAIDRYLRREGVPAVYWNVVSSNDCIETLIFGILYKVCGMSSSMALNGEIAELCVSLKRNSARSIAYDRVGLIQRFVHSKVDSHFGEGAQSRLPVKHMRNLLSVARLHLNLHDINSGDEDYLLYMDGLSTAMSNLEYFLPKETALPEGKTLFPKWRVRHLRPLSHFYRESIREKITDLEALSGDISLSMYAAEALKIYASEIV